MIRTCTGRVKPPRDQRVGRSDQLPTLLEKLDVEGVIVSSSDLLEKDGGEEFLEACRIEGVMGANLRMEFELIE